MKNPVRVSVVLISFGLDTSSSLRLAAELGFRYVQLRNVQTDLTVEAMTADRRKALLEDMEGLGLKISSLSGGYGSLFDGRQLEKRIEKQKWLARLTHDLGCDLLTGHLGQIGNESWKKKRGLVRQLSGWIDFLEKLEVTFAVETGSDHGELLRDFLDYFDSPFLAANLDPGNFVIYGKELLSSCAALTDKIVHLHFKDARRRPEPEKAPGTLKALELKGEEAAAGDGEVPFRRILPPILESSALRVAAVERETGSTRAQDIRLALQALKGLLEGYPYE